MDMALLARIIISLGKFSTRTSRAESFLPVRPINKYHDLFVETRTLEHIPGVLTKFPFPCPIAEDRAVSPEFGGNKFVASIEPH